MDDIKLVAIFSPMIGLPPPTVAAPTTRIAAGIGTLRTPSTSGSDH